MFKVLRTLLLLSTSSISPCKTESIVHQGANTEEVGSSGLNKTLEFQTRIPVFNAALVQLTEARTKQGQ